MTALGSLFNHGIPDPRQGDMLSGLVSSLDYVGVEIEMEDARRWGSMPLWEISSDGSLRNGGMELKFARPYNGTHILSALDELDAASKRARATFNDRCSLHVHIDVRDLTMQELSIFLNNYAYFEPHIFATIVPPSRRSNNFCVPYSQSSHKLAMIGRAVSSGSARELRRVLESCSKYDAVNLQAIQHFGSLEFRFFSGTTDKTEVLKAINLCLSFKEMARSGRLPTYTDRMSLTEAHHLYTKRMFAKYAIIYGSPPISGATDEMVKQGFMNVNLMHTTDHPLPPAKTKGMVQRALANKIAREEERTRRRDESRASVGDDTFSNAFNMWTTLREQTTTQGATLNEASIRRARRALGIEPVPIPVPPRPEQEDS